jgi:pimeloyl-ACP methyl ester carboxylesterase
MNHSSLENLERSLNENFNPTIIIDPRGVGYSKAPSEKKYYSIDRYADDIAKILDTEGISNVTFIGHSMGFMPAVHYAAKTENYNSLVGISASYSFPKTAKNRLGFFLFDHFLRYNEYLGSLMANLSHKAIGLPRVYNNQSLPEGSSDWSTYLSIVDVPLHEISNHIVGGKEHNKWDISNDLKKINKNILLIYGSKDYMVLPSTGEYIKGITKDCDIEIILDASHGVPITNPKAVIEILEKYNKM